MTMCVLPFQDAGLSIFRSSQITPFNASINTKWTQIMNQMHILDVSKYIYIF
jgi:hypothetical protein